MSKAELLQQIRESERQNAASLEQVESDRQASLRKAQQDRAGLVEKTRTKATKKAEKDFAKARKRIEALKQELLDDGLEREKKIRKDAEKKRGKAAKQFVTRFLESFNA
jgi:vacuolar-type H+-ATPase subunit H